MCILVKYNNMHASMHHLISFTRFQVLSKFVKLSKTLKRKKRRLCEYIESVR